MMMDDFWDTQEIFPGLPIQITALFSILAVSLVACSLPSLSRRYAFLRLPSILFFVGKHFGTGVILSTAFVHLLQDAFKNLSDPIVPNQWKGMTGPLVLVSLLVIFLVEYISTAYVERSEADAAVQSEPPPASPMYRDDDLVDVEEQNCPPESPAVANGHIEPDEEDGHSEHHHSDGYFEGHHRHEDSRAHRHNALIRKKMGQEAVPAYRKHGSSLSKQVIAILVLQTGIMLHSLVIGITLSISSGSEFTSLLTAVLFHQLFEGLSLGVRISTLKGHHATLRPLLCVLFAITLPIGMTIGLTSLPQSTSAHADPDQRRARKLSQGIMASISAGLLIYAGTVEMLAGDFVMDREIRKNSKGKQSVALLSLIVGAGVMGILGIWS